MTDDATPREVCSHAGLGMAPERDAVLAQLDDRTNQTWAGKRARWAALVRAQDAEIQRLRTALETACTDERERLRGYFRDALADKGIVWPGEVDMLYDRCFAAPYAPDEDA